MANGFQFEPVSFFVLLAMGCTSLALSYYFYSKSRILKEASKNLSVTVWDKTFNVFVPTENRRAITPSILLPVVAVLMWVFVGFLVLKILEMGLLLSISLFILSLGIMMMDEALDLRDHANVFINALKSNTKLAKGDVTTLLLLGHVMPKLSVYYIFTAAVFFVSAYALPYILSAVIVGLSVYSGTAATVASPLGVAMPYIAAFAFTFLFVMVYLGGGKLKNRIFGFPKSMSFRAMEEQFERGVRTITHGDSPPFEMSHRPILEDPEVEERKRKELDSEE